MKQIKIPIVLGQNLVQIQASCKKKRGHVKICLDDDVINMFFSKAFDDKLDKKSNKKIYLILEDDYDKENK